MTIIVSSDNEKKAIEELLSTLAKINLYIEKGNIAMDISVEIKEFHIIFNRFPQLMKPDIRVIDFTIFE